MTIVLKLTAHHQALSTLVVSLVASVIFTKLVAQYENTLALLALREYLTILVAVFAVGCLALFKFKSGKAEKTLVTCGLAFAVGSLAGAFFALTI